MKLTLAGGCFWCTEAVFKRLRGVSSVIPGYTGGSVSNPTYQQVCEGTTGHAEAIQITYDPSIITLRQLLEVFFHLHDPTTLNQQGADYGTQYRSAVFYQSKEEKEAAQSYIDELAGHQIYPKPIVTSLEPLGEFYEADESHRDYYARNSSQGYCQYVIDPKIQKLLKTYRPLVKEDYVSPRS